MNNKKGISLIVLVITILVMIILAGVVIVSLQDNNPIGKAKFAKTVDSIQSIRSAISQYAATAQALDDTYVKMGVLVGKDKTAIENLLKEPTPELVYNLDYSVADLKKILGVDPSAVKAYGNFKVNIKTGSAIFEINQTGVDALALKTSDKDTLPDGITVSSEATLK